MALLTLLGAALIVVLGRHHDERVQSEGSALGPSVVGGVAAAQPFNYAPSQRGAYERDAALGLSHVLFAKSPGGVVASARRTAHWRPIVDRVARRHGLASSMLEAIVMLESAGRADARASDDLDSAVGLTQILAETGKNLLHLKIDVKASERLTRGIQRGRRVRQREALRRRVDQRFDPAMAIEGAARYLDFAKGKLGRDDLAIVSYHMGVGNLQQALLAYGKGIVPYAQLYFDSSPLRHPAAWRKLASLGESPAGTPLELVNEWDKFLVRVVATTATAMWRFPLETASQSEGGFERTYQASVVVPVWREVTVGDGKVFETRVPIEVQPL